MPTSVPNSPGEKGRKAKTGFFAAMMGRMMDACRCDCGRDFSKMMAACAAKGEADASASKTGQDAEG